MSCRSSWFAIRIRQTPCKWNRQDRANLQSHCPGYPSHATSHSHAQTQGTSLKIFQICDHTAYHHPQRRHEASFRCLPNYGNLRVGKSGQILLRFIPSCKPIFPLPEAAQMYRFTPSLHFKFSLWRPCLVQTLNCNLWTAVLAV